MESNGQATRIGELLKAGLPDFASKRKEDWPELRARFEAAQQEWPQVESALREAANCPPADDKQAAREDWARRVSAMRTLAARLRLLTLAAHDIEESKKRKQIEELATGILELLK